MLRVLGTIFLLCLPALSQTQEKVRFVLAPEPLVADPAPSRLAPGTEFIGRAFAEACEQALPGHRPLTERDLLSPQEPTLVVVPRISALRATKDTVAGAIEHHKVIVVGEVALLDPWSMGRLYAATRMVYDEPSLGSGRSESEREELLRDSFRRVTVAWIKDCLDQIKRKAQPFTLRGGLLPDRPRGLRDGGIWPFGSNRGVEPGLSLTARSGARARVREVFPEFSVVVDPGKPGRDLGPGDEYLLTVVRGDAGQNERGEPRLQVRWRGSRDPMPPVPGLGAPLTREAWLGMAASYLSKDGRFRVLPVPETEGGAATQAWDRLKELLRNRSALVGVTGTQDVLALTAQRAPEVQVDFGILDAYQGTRPTDQGGMEHLFRCIWGMTWAARQGPEAPPIHSGFARQVEARTTHTKAGVRELEGAARWFQTCRDGLIKLVEAQAGRIPRPADPELAPKLRGVVQADRSVRWERGTPGPGTRLEWFRPCGEVRQAGKSLGQYYERRGALRLGASPAPGLEPGDELRFSAEYATERPLVALRAPGLESGSAPWLLDSAWLQPALAAELSRNPIADLVLEPDLGPNHPTASHFILRAEALPAARDGSVLAFKSVWRMRLYPGTPVPGGPLMPEGREPLFKLGRERLERFQDPPGTALQPPNLGMSALEAQERALQDLVAHAKTTGLDQAIKQKELP